MSFSSVTAGQLKKIAKLIEKKDGYLSKVTALVDQIEEAVGIIPAAKPAKKGRRKASAASKVKTKIKAKVAAKKRQVSKKAPAPKRRSPKKAS